MNQTPQLCSDILYEILSRTPLKTLVRCKSLSKEFNDIANDPQFLTLHASRTKTLSGYIVQYEDDHQYYICNSRSTVKLSLNFIPSRAYILASSNQGLLCCCHRDYYQYYICKPCTRQWRAVPYPNTLYVTKQVSLMVLKSSPLRFKIIRLSYPRSRVLDKFIYRFEIFDSRFWNWRELENVSLPYGLHTNNAGGMVFAGSVYWLLINNQVLEFNTDTESCNVFNCPKEIMTTMCKHKQLVIYKGKITFVCVDGFFLQWWVMKNIRYHIWEKMEKLNLASIEKHSPYHPLKLSLHENVRKRFPFRSDRELVLQFKEGVEKDVKGLSDRKPVQLKEGMEKDVEGSVEPVQFNEEVEREVAGNVSFYCWILNM